MPAPSTVSAPPQPPPTDWDEYEPASEREARGITAGLR